MQQEKNQEKESEFATTIVSAFMTGVNARKDIDISKYIAYGRKLVEQPVPKVIFIEHDVFLAHFHSDAEAGKYPLTEFRIIQKESIYLFQHLSAITAFDLRTTKPEKDTLPFLFVQCNKTEWVREVIHRNTFKTKQFTWIDFGIHHIIQDDFLLQKAVKKISRTTCEKVSIGSCWNIRLPFVRDIYRDVAWFFAGGIFGGEPEYLLLFADYMKIACLTLIQEKRHLMWETNIWYMVHQAYPEIFSPFLADHDTSLLTNYGTLPSSIVMVSAIYNPWPYASYAEGGSEEEESKYRTKFLEHLHFLSDIRCPLILFYAPDSIPQELQRYIGNTYQNISYLPLGDVTFPWSSEEALKQFAGIALPANRNKEKDTATHLWNMHAKVACMKHAIDFYLPNPYAFVWIDFDVSLVCSKLDKPFQTFLHQLSTRDYLPFGFNATNSPGLVQDQMIIPGCWSKLPREQIMHSPEEIHPEKMSEFLNNIYWRFCGGVMWGNANAIRKFWDLYVRYFSGFLEKHGVLTWEVNFWAWLETMDDDWNPVWYAGDHNDTMITLPSRFIAHRLGERYTDACYYKETAVIEVETSVISYPEIPNYFPTSASFLQLPNSEGPVGILNTRYVNYRILENGVYWWPLAEGNTIRNRNIVSQWDNCKKKPKTFMEMKSPILPPPIVERKTFSEGIEDIRLFWNREKQEVYWSGSTVNYAQENKIRIMMGKYDYESGELMDAVLIASPKDRNCEKNWIPIYKADTESTDLYFIYQWHPMEIGRLIIEGSGHTLLMEIQHETNPIVFRKIRGSSCFLLDTVEGVEGWVGVVHYSEDEHPTRQYFHRLVLLEKNTFKPLKYTDPFYFQKIGIEFCIGFAKIPENYYTFWISQMDRDPMVVEIQRDDVPRWNTCGRWGV
jgi:hypothetical protein